MIFVKGLKDELKSFYISFWVQNQLWSDAHLTENHNKVLQLKNGLVGISARAKALEDEKIRWA